MLDNSVVDDLPDAPFPPVKVVDVPRLQMGCAYKVRYGNQEEPPEYCDEFALPGLEFCDRHEGREF